MEHLDENLLELGEYRRKLYQREAEMIEAFGWFRRLRWWLNGRGLKAVRDLGELPAIEHARFLARNDLSRRQLATIYEFTTAYPWVYPRQPLPKASPLPR